MNNPWTIAPDERARHAAQFATLGPVGGFITGAQARNYFIRSNLPSNILAHIWTLADINQDGKMDVREFSIAVCLIQRKLAGYNLPQGLPDSLRAEAGGGMQMGVGMVSQSPATSGMSTPMMGGPTSSMGQPIPGFGTTPMQMPGMMGGVAGFGMTPPGGAGALSMGSSPLGGSGFGHMPVQPSPPAPNPMGSILPNPNRRVEWAMPPASKLKHSQMFNTLDKNRIGSLSGVHARNIMSQSGLPHPVLAQIWTLSDVDKDGKLTCDEFCIAMHLIDKVRGGESDLPQVLPPELRPSAVRTRTASIGAASGVPLPPLPGAEGVGGDFVEPPAAGEESPRQQTMTFEDRLRQNRDRAQAEIERRRQILQEQERREREERERKEREEEEKRQREREEQERRRHAELEKEMARQRELEHAREAERRRILEQKRAAQEEMEKQRQIEMDRLKLQVGACLSISFV